MKLLFREIEVGGAAAGQRKPWVWEAKPLWIE